MMLKTLLLLAWRYLSHRRFATTISVFAIAVSLIFVVGVGIVNFAVKKTAIESSIRYPLIVGPEGSSGVQLILSNIFYIDKPAGILPYSVFESLKKDPRVTAAYPLAVADSYQNIRMIGTNEAFLENLGVGISAGRLDLSDTNNVVVGSEAAKRGDLEIGDTFHVQHGLVGSEGADTHKNAIFQVVGILNSTGGPEDSAIYTSIEAVWTAHAGHHHDPHHNDGLNTKHASADVEDKSHDSKQRDESDREHEGEHDTEHKSEYGHDKYHLSDGKLTAVLVRTRNPVYTGMLERDYSLAGGTVAVDTGRTIREFVGHINKGESFVEAVSAGMLVISLALILVTLVMSVNERRKDLALLRILGVGRGRLALTVMIEALVITIAGTIGGLLLGHIFSLISAGWIKANLGVDIEPLMITKMEALALGITLVAGQLMALAGMWLTYRFNVVEEIGRNS